MNDRASAIVREFNAGTLDRRGAVKQLLSTGLSAPAAYVAIGAIAAPAAAQAASTADDTGQQTLQQNFEALNKLISSPEMVEAIAAAESEPDKRKAADILIRTANSPSLRARVGLSDDSLRTSMRVFERDATRGTEEILARTRRIGSAGVTTYPSNGVTPPIPDDSLVQYAQGLEASADAGARPVDGVCVSYGKDVCVSAGIP